jgi:hypothetical protein
VENQLQHLASIIQVLDPKLHGHLGMEQRLVGLLLLDIQFCVNICWFYILQLVLVDSSTQKHLAGVTISSHSACSWYCSGENYHLGTPCTFGR